MGSVEETDIVRKAEAILASAKSFKGDRTKRYELMKQLDLLHSELEDPMDSMMKQWSSVSSATPRYDVEEISAADIWSSKKPKLMW
jgi:hypothetical protein